MRRRLPLCICVLFLLPAAARADEGAVPFPVLQSPQSVSTAPAQTQLSTAAPAALRLKSLSFCDLLEEKLAETGRPGKGGLKKTAWQMEPARAERKTLDDIARNERLARKFCADCRAQRTAAGKYRIREDQPAQNISPNLYRMSNLLERQAEKYYKKVLFLRRKRQK